MEKNGLKVSRANTERLMTKAGTYPVGMIMYMETETVNLPTVRCFKHLESTINSKRGGGQHRRG